MSTVRGVMSNILKASILFGFLQSVTTIAIIIVCFNYLSASLSISAVIITFIVSTYFSHELSKSIHPQRLGIGVGIFTSIINLVICVIVLLLMDVNPSRLSFNSVLFLILIAFLQSGIFVMASGALMGWVCQRYLNALSKPLTPHSSATTNDAAQFKR